jgi:arginyl-tRNA synthetase
MVEARPSQSKALLAGLIEKALTSAYPAAPAASVILERPKDPRHGDFACNVAMQLARALRRPPREIARAIADHVAAPDLVDRLEVAGAGFLNVYLNPHWKRRVVQEVLTAGPRYGTHALGQNKKVQVEYVSANPTGPLHVGHGRGAAFGASLANVLEAAGFDVTREYYVNDAGRQMDILALSTWLRYLELVGLPVAFPANAYRGDYVRQMAQTLRERDGRRYVREITGIAQGLDEPHEDPEAHLDALIAAARRELGDDFPRIHAHALEAQLADCRADLREFGVTFDEWFSERSLHASGAVERAIARLAAAGHVYEMDGAQWFRSSAFGDEKDRVLRRENGQYTYFASDIAYHANKFERGFDLAVDVWGADHHGYIARVKGALEALGLNREQLVVALVQFAVLYRAGQKVSMSTRSGEFVTLRELREEVGNDAARFFYVLRKSDQHLDFDLDLAKSQSNENPVYYIQYAHARVCSIHEQWGGAPEELIDTDASPLVLEQELALLERLIAYPETVEAAAREFAPHLIAFYLRDLAGEFHSYYNATRILAPEPPLKLARVALATAVREVVRNALALLGVSAPEKM